MFVTRRTFVGMLGSSVVVPGRHAFAQDALRVCVFPGISNLPIFAAQNEGYFQKRGVAGEIVNTVNSDELRDGLAHGRHPIAHSGVDNAIALAELAKVDIAVVIGGHGCIERTERWRGGLCLWWPMFYVFVPFCCPAGVRCEQWRRWSYGVK